MRLFCSYLLLGLLLIGCNPKEKPTSEASVPFMFVQTADSGTFEATKDNTSFKLTLNNVSPQTIYFSDRPSRIAGDVANDKFITGLGFDPANPPNAAVVLSEPESKESDVVIVSLFNPVYDANKKTLSYDAKPLDNLDGTGLAFWHPQKDTTLPSSFSKVSVFIDDCPDGMVHCYGSYESGRQKKCRTECGVLGKKVGYCWSWTSLDCKPCHDYVDECKKKGAPCVNSIDPACTKHSCSTSRDCM